MSNPQSVRELNEQRFAVKQTLADRLKDDPVANFKPHNKQRDFIEAILVRKVRRAAFIAANRSGKSECGAYVGAKLSRYGWDDPSPSPHAGAAIQIKDRATSGWVVSRDFPSSRDIVQPKFFNNGYGSASVTPFIPQREIDDWSVSNQILRLKNGSIIGFKSCDSDVVKFAGAGKDWIMFDEEPPQSHYEEAVIRVEAGRRLVIWFTCTLLPPAGETGGISWMFDEFIKPWKRGELENMEIINCSIYDNPFIGREEIEALESIYPEGSVARRIRLNGEMIPGMGGAQVHPGFNRSIHVRDQMIDPRLPLCWCWDFNVSPLITHLGQRDGDIFRIIKQFKMDDGNIPDMCEWVYQENFKDHAAEIIIYGDASGSSRTAQTTQSDYKIIMSEMRQYGLPLRMRVPTKNPFVEARVNAVNRALKGEGGRVNVVVDPSCHELIDDFEQVLLDPRGGIKKSHNNRDPYFKRTHALEGVSYWIAYEAPVRSYSVTKRPNTRVRDIGYNFG